MEQAGHDGVRPRHGLQCDALVHLRGNPETQIMRANAVTVACKRVRKERVYVCICVCEVSLQLSARRSVHVVRANTVSVPCKRGRKKAECMYVRLCLLDNSIASLFSVFLTYRNEKENSVQFFQSRNLRLFILAVQCRGKASHVCFLHMTLNVWI